MRKIFTLIVTLFAILGTVNAADREHTLKIYNWADYIDEDVLSEFADWYYEQTGEEVEVIYQLFDVNEIMLAKIERGKEDFDVVCPSEYIIERMLRHDLLLPIDKDFGDTPNYIDNNISPYIIERFNMIDGSGKNANDYSVGYMWGTTGLLYNTKYITAEQAASWSVLHNPALRNKIFIKDAFRDVYGPILVYLKREAIDRGEVTLDEVMYDASDESIALVEQFLKTAKNLDLIAGWEADFGKEMMTKEKAYINLTWSGDAVWAIEEATSVGVSLDYYVPDEGSNVWFDGWVIPKYAKNIKAARYFINYMCRSDIALRNMDAIGYVSAVATPEVLEAKCDDSLDYYTDVSYFFGEGAERVKIDAVQYPDRSVIERCAMMHDSGARTEQMLEMWTRVKGEVVKPWVLIVIVVTMLLLLIFGIRRKVLQYRRRSRRYYRRKR